MRNTACRQPPRPRVFAERMEVDVVDGFQDEVEKALSRLVSNRPVSRAKVMPALTCANSTPTIDIHDENADARGARRDMEQGMMRIPSPTRHARITQGRRL